jgi:phosphoribosylanthranilate isomerase
MIIDKISFTGADDKTDISHLEALQFKYPGIEWALLYFPERDGAARNPTLSWREKFYQAKLTSAMHLCGSGINQFAEGNSQLLHEIEQFQRIQINLKPRWASPELVDSVIKQCEKFPQIQFITQHNPDNIAYIPLWQELKNHGFLFDASLGKGLSPEVWPSPVAGKDCGYAGGLSPENIRVELAKIKRTVNNSNYDSKYKIWIDMESGVRTNDEFDLSKVQSILNVIYN